MTITRLITSKICIVPKNGILEKVLEIKKIYKATYISFSDLYWGFSAIITEYLPTLNMHVSYIFYRVNVLLINTLLARLVPIDHFQYK